MPPPASPPWAAFCLRAAAVYNLAWGAAVIAFPNLLFDLTGATRPNYPEIWQCVGMIVGVYGLGYWLAASDPYRHWPITLVGLLGKLFGPVGFAVAVARGVFPPAFGLTILTNDLIWWVPFTLILWGAFLNRGLPSSPPLTRFVKETRVAATPEAVFAFHQNPDALARLTPPWEPLKVTAGGGSLDAGTRVTLSGRVLGLPLVWVAEHTECRPPTLFADRQVSGPFDHWHHRHEFVPDGTGTLLRDDVEYAPPFGWVGRVLLGGFVRAKLEKMFAYRHDQTRKAVEAGHG